jgi:hypothetical protein
MNHTHQEIVFYYFFNAAKNAVTSLALYDVELNQEIF